MYVHDSSTYYKYSYIEVDGLQKGVIFSEDSLPYLWKWNVHATSQFNRIGTADIIKKVFLRTALSACFLELELVEQRFTMGLQKENFLFMVYKDQQAANTFYCLL